MVSFVRTFSACLLFASFASAQDPASLPDKPQPQPKTQSGWGKKRILGIIPANDVTTLNAKDHFSAKDKAHLFAMNSFDFFTLISAAADAGISQATDTPHGFGQGGEGYAKRYGSAVADQIGSNFFTLYAYPVIFRQDPRYFQKGTGSFGSRAVYAMSRVFVARTDAGHSAFNISHVLGVGTSAALTNAYYPEEERTAENTLTRFGARLGVDMGINLFKEFWPSIQKKMSHKNKR